MTAYDELFQRTGLAVQLRQFAETVVYRPKAGTARAITAIVDRNPPEAANEAGAMNQNRFVVCVKDDELDGVGIRELNTGGDAFDIEKRRGEAASTMYVSKLLNQDGGYLELEVR